MRASTGFLAGSCVAMACTAACSSTTNRNPGTRDASADVAVSPSDARAGDGNVTDGSSTPADANAADGALPTPTITGPIIGGKYGIPFNSMPVGLAAQAGYTEEEFFVTGTARSFEPVGTWGSDGKWGAAPNRTAPYETRILVRRPSDASKFSGTVFVEWLNVSAGIDSDPDFGQGHVEILRNGDAYVGVSAQLVGIEGGSGLLAIPGVSVQALKLWDPERYGPLHHPGDDYSYDMFAQAGAALRKPNGVDPLGGLSPEHVIAVGESQSAFRMVTFVDAVHPLTRAYDGFFIHSRSGNGTALSAATATSIPAVVSIRDDLSVPVFQFETESDLFFLGFYGARQPDTEKLRTWEVAGTSHADQYEIDYGGASDLRADPDASDNPASTCGAINDGPQTYVVRAALSALRAWVASGTAPSAGTPFQIADAGNAIARDEHGNALGGVRTPEVDVPVETLTGVADLSKGVLCALLGSTTPFDAATLLSLYPTHQDYVSEFTAAADRAVTAGHLLGPDRDEVVQSATAAPVPK